MAGLAALAPLQQLAALNLAGCCGLTHEGATVGPRQCVAGTRSRQMAGQVARYWMSDAWLQTILSLLEKPVTRLELHAVRSAGGAALAALTALTALSVAGLARADCEFVGALAALPRLASLCAAGCSVRGPGLARLAAGCPGLTQCAPASAARAMWERQAPS